MTFKERWEIDHPGKKINVGLSHMCPHTCGYENAGCTDRCAHLDLTCTQCWDRTMPGMISGTYHITCEVCGCDFAPLNNANHYVVETGDGTFGDAFDCPQCGCQNVVNVRYRTLIHPKQKTPRYIPYKDMKRTPEQAPTHPVTRVFANVHHFTKVLEQIHECMAKYGHVTLDDLHDFCDEESMYAFTRVGWNNTLDMKIEVDGNGYTLIMPPFNWEAKSNEKQ